MSEIWFTADTHFDHKNIINFCSETRPYENVDEMNEALIDGWNEMVSDNDTVYHLGDVAFSGNPEQYVSRLKGNKHLILGNHDGYYTLVFKKGNSFLSIENYRRIRYAKTHIVLFHYPIASWEMISHGAWHLYGHVHGKSPENMPPCSMDVGIDATGKILVNFDEIMERFTNNG